MGDQEQAAVTVPSVFGQMIPLSRERARRMLWRQAQERYRELEQSVDSASVETEPLYPGSDPARAKTYLDLPIPAAFRRVHRIPEGQHEIYILPNHGPGEIDPELEHHLEDRKMGEGALPPPALSGEYEAWVTAVASREREQRRIFGPLPELVLVDLELDEMRWHGSFVIIAPKEGDERPVTVLTSGVCDRDLRGEATSRTRDYELYIQTAPGGERWAVNLLRALVVSVLEKNEDHLEAVRSARHVVLDAVSVPGLERPFPFLLGVRTPDIPRALPISGGASKLIPVTLIHAEELALGRETDFEELAVMLVEEGIGVVSDPDRPAVVQPRPKKRWKLW